MRREYVCLDGVGERIRRRMAKIRDFNEQRKVSGSAVTYVVDGESGKLQGRINVSGVQFSRDMVKMFGASDGIRTIIFPGMVRAIQ